MFGLCRQGQVHGDEVGSGEQILHGRQLDAKGTGCFLCDKGIIAQHFHAEGDTALHDLTPDFPQPDDTDRLTSQFDARVGAALPLPCLERGRGLRNVAGQRHQHAKGELSRGYRVAARCVGDDDASARRRFDVDVVDTGPRSAYHPQPTSRTDQLFSDHGTAAHDETIILADDRHKFLLSEPGVLVHGDTGLLQYGSATWIYPVGDKNVHPLTWLRRQR